MIENIDINTSNVFIKFKTNRLVAKCPCYGDNTNTISTYYIRTIQDLPIIDKNTLLSIKSKKFRCLNTKCKTKFFSESLDEIVKPKSRKTKKLQAYLTKIALLNSAEMGSKICKNNNINVSPDTLLNFVNELKKDYNAIINNTKYKICIPFVYKLFQIVLFIYFFSF